MTLEAGGAEPGRASSNISTADHLKLFAPSRLTARHMNGPENMLDKAIPVSEVLNGLFSPWSVREKPPSLEKACRLINLNLTYI